MWFIRVTLKKASLCYILVGQQGLDLQRAPGSLRGQMDLGLLCPP